MNKETTASPAGKVHQPDEKKKKDEASKGMEETYELAKESLIEGTIDKKKDKKE